MKPEKFFYVDIYKDETTIKSIWKTFYKKVRTYNCNVQFSIFFNEIDNNNTFVGMWLIDKRKDETGNYKITTVGNFRGWKINHPERGLFYGIHN